MPPRITPDSAIKSLTAVGIMLAGLIFWWGICVFAGLCFDALFDLIIWVFK